MRLIGVLECGLSLAIAAQAAAGQPIDTPPLAVHLTDVGETVSLTAPPLDENVRWRLRVGPDTVNQLDRFVLPDAGEDRYGTRIRGFIHPPVTGEYRFWLASDDAGELRLSSDDRPDNARLIAYVERWTGPQKWDEKPTQASDPIQLEAGRRYFIELLHKEGDGADHGAVAWSGPDLPRQVIDGQYLSPLTPDGSTGPRGSITREVWRNIPGSRIENLIRSPGYEGSARLEVGSDAASLRPLVPGRFVLELVGGDGQVRGQSVVIAIDGIRRLLGSPGFAQLDSSLQQLTRLWLGERNIISDAARLRLSEWISSEAFADLDPQAQAETIQKWLRTPLFHQTWASSPAERAPYTLGDPEPIELYTYWPNRKGPGFKRVAVIEGESFSIQGPRADMVEMERIAIALAGIPKPLRDLVSTAIIDPGDANQWNGGNSTIYVRVSGVPSQTAIDSTITHELGHLLDHQFDIHRHWRAVMEADVLPVSGYGNSNPGEDFAEFVRLYFSLARDGQSPERQLAAMYSNRWAFLSPILDRILDPPAKTALSEIPADVTSVWLSEIAPAFARVGWATPLYDSLPEMAELASAFRSFERAIYAHATATHRYELSGGWKRFTATAALQKGHEGSVVFVVRGDGRELLRTPLVSGDAEHAIDLDIGGVNVLELIVEDGGDGGGNDWGMWFEPHLER